MNKAIITIMAIIGLSISASAGDMGWDFNVKLEERGGVQARVGFDLMSLKDQAKTGSTPKPDSMETGGSADKGIFKRLGSWISENPWKAAIITAGVLYGGYEVYDNNKGGSSRSESHTKLDDKSDNRSTTLSLADVQAGDDINIVFNNFSMPFEEE